MKSYRKLYRIRKKKSIFKNRFFWLAILILIAITSLFYIISFSSFFQIKEIRISGNSQIQEQELKNKIENKISRKLFFTETKSIFLVDLKGIKSSVLEFFPKIEKLEIKRGFFDSLKIEIKERDPVAVFRQGEKYFLTDSNGFVFEETISAGSYFIIENQNLYSEIKPGEQAVFEEIFSQIINIKNNLIEELNISSVAVVIISDQRVNFETADGWEIYFNLKGDLNWQMSALDALLENKIPPENRKNLKYIDLRFNKIYVSPEGILD
ncbi:cell division protein FtsQ/DivIB [Patescibacteria group bacterium]